MTAMDLAVFLRSYSSEMPEGSVTDNMLRVIHKYLRHSPPKRSVETGCGRMTALL